jgi:ADP-ribose pyrophosphatase YjhB (NUDIX family)
MTDQWNSFKEPRPYVTVSGIAIDDQGRFPLLHRSENVRSARNCWSLPSGLHEVGLTLREQFATELKEEMGLDAIQDKSVVIGAYENIRPDGPDKPGWHWVIFFLVMRVKTLDTLVNTEPEKHDKIDVVNFRDQWASGRIWAPKLEEFIRGHHVLIQAQCEAISKATINW